MSSVQVITNCFPLVYVYLRECAQENDILRKMTWWHPDTKPPNSAGGYSFHLLTFNLILLGNWDPVEFVEDTHPPLEKWYDHHNQKSITSIFI